MAKDINGRRYAKGEIEFKDGEPVPVEKDADDEGDDDTE